MKQRAQVSFCKEEFAVADLAASAWSRAEPVAIDSYWNGEPAPSGRRAEARLLWSETSLYLRFEARQTEPLFVNSEPQTSEKTMELWERDVCELFLAPDGRNRRRYFEFEIAPTGEWLDLVLDWMKDDPKDWDLMSGMEAYSRIEEKKVTMMMKIPWTGFGVKPKPGDVWLGNLFRCVGSGATRGYLAWSPTMTAEPQFHVPEKFGDFVFEK